MAPTNHQDLSKLAKDALYVTVGLGVMSVQKARVRRNELQKELRGQVDVLGKRFEDRVKTLEERWQALLPHGTA